jgi:GNAT superfamily N-acetyltransferase
MQRESCIVTGGGAQRNTVHELLCHSTHSKQPAIPAAAPDGRGILATIVQGADSTMIRKATRADRPRILEIRFAVRENRPSNPALIEPLVDWLFDNSTFWVWEEDSAIQGFSAADPRDGSICALFVHPFYERRGIGRALLPQNAVQTNDVGHGRPSLC